MPDSRELLYWALRCVRVGVRVKRLMWLIDMCNITNMHIRKNGLLCMWGACTEYGVHNRQLIRVRSYRNSKWALTFFFLLGIWLQLMCSWIRLLAWFKVPVINLNRRLNHHSLYYWSAPCSILCKEKKTISETPTTKASMVNYFIVRLVSNRDYLQDDLPD